jgi:3'-phosphoadenosine 5'-phosphosulfate sulfotransferase (PAPS reductase)/FAD synthetase
LSFAESLQKESGTFFRTKITGSVANTAFSRDILCDKRRWKMPKHIVSFSGGKDSTAMLLMMLERGMQIDEIRCFDTGWEFPQMYDHWKQVEAYIGREITILRPKKSFEYWMLERPVVRRKDGFVRTGYGWPSALRRWCTSEKRGALNRGRTKDIWYIGIAADEGHRQKPGKVYPLLEWGVTEEEALQYCYDKGFHWNGLYKHFSRVSCFCCPLTPLGELRKVRRYYPELWLKMLDWDTRISPESKGFKDVSDLHSLDARFAQEDLQLSLFEEV